MTEYPIWDDWYSVAEPLNKFTGWVTILISFLWWFLSPIQRVGYNFNTLSNNTWRLILGILSAIFYIIVVQPNVKNEILTKTTHVWLWICFVLSWFPGYGGVLIWIEFVMVGILSDIPFWVAFSE
ncbi:MAG: hypothetical protein ACFFD2_00860 [Promethearchaeota archaeon]